MPNKCGVLKRSEIGPKSLSICFVNPDSSLTLSFILELFVKLLGELEKNSKEIIPKYEMTFASTY